MSQGGRGRALEERQAGARAGRAVLGGEEAADVVVGGVDATSRGLASSDRARGRPSRVNRLPRR